MIDLVPDVVEEILLRLPLKSILKFKTVSKQWRSILESRSFVEKRRMIMKKLQKKPQILASAKKYQTVRQLILEKEEEEVELEMNYIRSHAAATRPWLTCDGLVCIPVPGWVNIMNPSTREVLRFPSGPADVVKNERYNHMDEYWDYFPGDWAMGFGKDKVNGSYKVVRMFFDTNQFDILDVDIGEWRKLPSPPPYYADPRRKSECVNGSIYWLRFVPSSYTLLALDLHTEEFRDIHAPPSPAPPRQGHIVNLEDRLTLATVYNMRYNWVLYIWSMDQHDETWSNTYTIPLFSRVMEPLILRLWCRPVAVSKRGNLYFYDNQKRLFKYYPQTNLVSCICLDTRVLFPFVENLLPLPRPDSAPKIRTFGFHYLDHVPGSWNSKFCRLIQLRNPNILLTTTVAVAALVLFRYYTVFSRF